MKREKYIPFDKEFLLEQQFVDFNADKKEAEDLKKFFDILEHYFHYEAFNLNRKLKQNYALFDPDLTAKEREGFIGKSDLSVFKENLYKVVERGNYVQVDRETIDEAFKNSDLIGLKLAIDFNDFRDYGIFVRGHHKTKEKVTRFFIFKKEIEFEYYDRVMIYLNYNDANYFNEKNIRLSKLPFDPGCIVLKIFKRVPKNDLETIFPNAVPKMSNIDKILFWVPGIGGGISLLASKVIPALVAMYGAYKSGEAIDLLDSKTSLNQGLIALGVLGGYLFRQYSSFVNKKIKYSKMLSDSLYFKNLGNNSGAFYSLLNSSEEEELKETILAYSFLNRSKSPLTAKELDSQIESWFKTKHNTDLDFDVEDALYKLQSIGLGSETNGKWKVIPLGEALIRIDEIWDGIFEYNQK
ncbi:MAG TPA: TMEM143 family protein [Tenuifilaceae bacterium]|nr:TMEM143 family protein [Tenuifilaceae bacterium]HOZ13173.1 TMEM143 family protein [Tenuifilaceae bacterium]HPI44904.1 TMEM143 family protein [Tenuifilaceae bacterium]HPN21680.1 TMEM143 family protein [Tenuifilaceae bacterium]HPV56054.1 TMEM143 family protein [Tenuifilaceae bacterium]